MREDTLNELYTRNKIIKDDNEGMEFDQFKIEYEPLLKNAIGENQID